MRSKIIMCLCCVLFITAGDVKADPDPPKDAKTIFTSRCASCHNVNKVVVGPALALVDERHSIDWIIQFVQSSQSLVKKGDKDATALFEKFNKIPMPDHPDLTEENIKSIVEYIKSETKTVTEEKAPFKKLSKKMPNYTPLSISNDYEYFISFFISVFILIGALLFAVHVRNLK